MPTKAISPDERSAVVKLLDRLMTPTERAYPQASEPTVVEGMGTDPDSAFALEVLRQRYPQVFGRVQRMYLGASEEPGVGGSTMRSGYGPGASVAITPQLSVGKAFDTIRHELAHVAGQQDPGALPNQKVSAYDVGQLSDLLHSDVDLSATGVRSPFLKSLLRDVK